MRGYKLGNLTSEWHVMTDWRFGGVSEHSSQALLRNLRLFLTESHLLINYLFTMTIYLVIWNFSTRHVTYSCRMIFKPDWYAGIKHLPCQKAKLRHPFLVRDLCQTPETLFASLYSSYSLSHLTHATFHCCCCCATISWVRTKPLGKRHQTLHNPCQQRRDMTAGSGSEYLFMFFFYKPP
jgi:hypothetical protein